MSLPRSLLTEWKKKANLYTRTTSSWNVSAVWSTCLPCCRIWSMLWWQLPKPQQITWSGAKDGTSSWRRASTSACPSCCQRGDTPVILWEESLQGLGIFWNQFARQVWDIYCIEDNVYHLKWVLYWYLHWMTSFSSRSLLFNIPAELERQLDRALQWTNFFCGVLGKIKRRLCSVVPDVLKYNLGVTSHRAFIEHSYISFLFPSKGSTQRAGGCDYYTEQTSEQWDGGQHCGCQGDLIFRILMYSPTGTIKHEKYLINIWTN